MENSASSGKLVIEVQVQNARRGSVELHRGLPNISMSAKDEVLEPGSRPPSPSPGGSLRAQPHLYRGHRRQSFTPIDNAELVELRARQRTFDGAYARTAISTLGYTIIVLKLFDDRFYRIGLLYCILTAVLASAAIIRRRHSRHDFADQYGEDSGRWNGQDSPTSGGRTSRRVFGRPFNTAGWIVVIVTLLVAALLIAMLVSVATLSHSS